MLNQWNVKMALLLLLPQVPKSNLSTLSTNDKKQEIRKRGTDRFNYRWETKAQDGVGWDGVGLARINS